jgi:xanthine dehydrogenase accessory factor
MTRAINPEEIYRKIIELIDAQRRFALVLVLKADGSTPLKAGAKAIIEEDGHIIGTIGGGQVEAEAQKRAIEACKSGEPLVFDFQLHGISKNDNEPICGGTMRILIDPISSKDKAIYTHVTEAIEQRRRGVLLTTIKLHPGTPCGESTHTKVDIKWIPENQIANHIIFPGSEKIFSCLKYERAQLFIEGEPKKDTLTKVFVEPVIPRPNLIIAGGGHIGQALALQASLVGFDINVIDDRLEFTDPALYPEGTKTYCDDIPEKVAELLKDDESYIVIVTRGHKLDAEVLEACISRKGWPGSHKPVVYIGMIGSERKVKLMRKNFIESGLATADEFDRVFAPIGLDIGSVTVAEIAVSITAQLIAVRRKRLADIPMYIGAKKSET